MVPPKVIRSVDPEFSEEARQTKFSGRVQFALEVDAKGRPNNIWIAKLAGMGLDRNAVEAIRQYVFAPATCHGIAVPVSLFIDVNFEIF